MNRCWCGCEDLLPFSEYYRKCGRCGTLVSAGIDTDSTAEAVSGSSDSLYGESYWKEHMLSLSGCESLDGLVSMYLKSRVPYWVSVVLKYHPYPGKLCEVGCGLGAFSYMMKLCGFDVEAMELSRNICEWIENNMFLDVTRGELEARTEKADMIAAFDVLEHIASPREFVSSADSVLEDGGMVFIQTPCYDGQSSYEEMKSRKDRFLLLMEEKEHVFLYTKESAQRLFAENGFVCCFEDAYFGNDYDMFFVASKGGAERKTAEEIRKYLYSMPAGRLVASVIELEKEFRDASDALQKANVRLAEFDRDVTVLNQVVCELRRESEMKDAEIASFRDIWMNYADKKQERQILTILAGAADIVARRKMLTAFSKCRENVQEEEEWDLIRESVLNYIRLTDILMENYKNYCSRD